MEIKTNKCNIWQYLQSPIAIHKDMLDQLNQQKLASPVDVQLDTTKIAGPNRKVSSHILLAHLTGRLSQLQSDNAADKQSEQNPHNQLAKIKNLMSVLYSLSTLCQEAEVFHQTQPQDQDLASSALARIVRIVLQNLENFKSVSLAIEDIEQLITVKGLSKIPELSQVLGGANLRAVEFRYLICFDEAESDIKKRIQPLSKLLEKLTVEKVDKFPKAHQQAVEELSLLSGLVIATQGGDVSQLQACLNVHFRLKQFTYCLSIKDPEFRGRHLSTVIGLMREGHILHQSELPIIRQIVKVWEVESCRDKVSEFIQVVFNMTSNNADERSRIVEIVNTLLNSNVEQVVAHNLNILPYFEQLDQRIRGVLYEKCLPLALKALERKENNIDLSNFLVEWRLKLDKADNERFLSFFQKVIAVLSESSLLLIYSSPNPVASQMMTAIARYLRQRKNLKEDFLRKFLLSETLKKVRPENTSTSREFQSVLKVLILMHQSPNQTLSFPQATARYHIRNFYISRLAPIYDSCEKPTDAEQWLVTLELLFKVEALMQNALISQRVSSLLDDAFIFLYRHPEMCEKLLGRTSALFSQLPNSTSCLIYLSCILYSAITIEVVGDEDKELGVFEGHIALLAARVQDETGWFIYSPEAFKQCVYLYLLRGNTDRTIEHVRAILTCWIRLATLKEIAYLYDVCKHEVSSEFIQQELKALQELEAKASYNSPGSRIFASRRVIMSTDLRVVNFLQLFFRVAQALKQDEQSTRSFGKFMRSGFSNRMCLTYQMPNFKEIKDFCNFQLKLVILRQAVSKGSGALSCSRVETAPPEYQSAHMLLVRVQAMEHIIYMNNSNVYTVIRRPVGSSDQRVLDTFVDKNPHFKSSLTLKFDVLEKKLTVELNSVKVCELVCKPTEDCSHIEVEYESNEEAALSALKVRQGDQKWYTFPLENLLEIKDAFAVRLDHLKSCIKVWGGRQYFELKYLFALLIQVASGKYSYTLKSIQMAFDSLYDIVLSQLMDIPEEQEDFLIMSLHHLTDILVSKDREIDLSAIESGTLVLLESPDPKPIFLRFCLRILLNFDLWMHCPFNTQLVVLELAGKVSNKLKKPSMREALYKHILMVTFEKYNHSSEGGFRGIRAEDLLAFRKEALRIVTNLISYDHTKVAVQQFQALMECVAQESKHKHHRTHLIGEAVGEILEKLLSPHYKLEVRKLQVFRKEPIIDVLLSTQLQEALKCVSGDMKGLLLGLALHLLGTIPDEKAGPMLKAILSSITVEEFEQYSERIMEVLFSAKNSVERGEYTKKRSVVQLLVGYLSRYQQYPEQKQEEILSVMLVYFQTQTGMSDQHYQERLSLSALFARQPTITFMVRLIEQDEAPNQSPLKDKRKKLLQALFKCVFRIPKADFLQFMSLFRLESRISLLGLQFFLMEAITNSVHTPLPILSATLQFCFSCAVWAEADFTEEKEPLTTLVYNYVKNLVDSHRSMIYSTVLWFGYPQFSSRKMLEAADSTKPLSFEMRGGLFFKILLVLFKCLELLRNPDILEYLVGLFTTHVDKLPAMKEIREARKQVERAGQDFFRVDKELAYSNEVEELIKKMGDQYDKKCHEKPVLESPYQEDKTRGEVSIYCLDYVLLRLALIIEDSLNEELSAKAAMSIKELLSKYPKLRFDTEPSSMSDLQHLHYKDFEEWLTCQGLSPPDSPIKSSRTPQHDANLPSFNSPIKKLKSQRQMPKSMQKSGFLEVSRDFLARSGLSPDPQRLKRRMSLSTQRILDAKEESQTVDLIKKYVRKEAKKLVILENMYTYLAEKCNSSANPIEKLEEPAPPSWLEASHRVQADKLRIEASLKQFLESCHKEDGLLFERINKKEPILKIKSVYVTNQTYPITKFTTDYNYAIEKQEKLPLIRKTSYLNYSFLKSQGSFAFSVISQEQEKPLITLPAEQVPAEQHLFGSFLSDQSVTSPFNKGSYDCELITVRGAYFCSFRIDQRHWKMQLESDGKGRPNLPELRYGSPKENILLKKLSITINVDDIQEALARKFNQIPNNSLEIFTKRAKASFIVFYNPGYARQILKVLKKSGRINPQRLVDNCESTFKKRKYTEKWASGQITNFEYLMLLNRFSGRSFNDPNQYYVFPWVLADYESSTLNLADPRVFRNLELPIGAVNTRKLQRYLENQRTQQSDKYLFGSFFSTSLFVFFYLVRLEPYSTMARQLQNNNFDAADRLFISIANTWESVMKDSNTSDVKELIPEFYYLPTFLENHNNLILGRTQDGMQVSSVVLPPWANGANDFVTKMRAALESDIVTAKLHCWIDLVFGAHQNNRKRFNVFHPRYYAENINYEQLSEEEIDPMIAQITYFGQFPTRLFSKDHPKRVESVSKYLVGIELNPRKPSIRIEELDAGKSIESMVSCGKRVIFCLNEIRATRHYYLDLPLESLKRVEMNSKMLPAALFEPHLTFEEGRAQFLYLHTDPNTKILLKRFRLDREYTKAIASDRFIAMCGRKGMSLIDFEGREYLSWTKQPVIDLALTTFSVLFVVRPLQLLRMNIVSRQVEVIASIEEAGKIYDIRLVAYQDNQKESYVMAINRKKIMYITRSSS